MIVLFKIFQVILALSLLIIIHELGHFLSARMFGIRVDKFFLFFDVGGKAIFRKRIGQTEFGIGWLPFGGYCKIAGMIDESLDTSYLGNEPQPWEFRAHPAWQRLIVMAGGVFNNFLFAIIAFCIIVGVWGTAYIPNENAHLLAGPLAEEMGFRTGDRVLLLDSEVPEDFAQLQADIVRRDIGTVTVLRGADTVVLYLDRSMVGRMLEEQMFGLAIPFVVDSVASGSPNTALQPGDAIVSVAGEKVRWRHEASAVLAAHKGSTVDAGVMRDGVLLGVPLQVDTAGLLGIFIKAPEVRSRTYTFWESIPAGVEKTFSTIGGYIRDLGLLLNPSTKAYKSVGSFIAIGQIFPSVWNWYQFMSIIALLSVMLAVMNLLPIPGLDGGHIVFTIYEMITGRKPSDRFMMAAQLVGMAILLLLMVLAFGNDIGRLL